uniref:Band 7 domain-containing protein n=1 Tax=Globodera rostochiensis TaxID=31243 RepID=A0A914H9Q2_GLORO
MHLLHEVRARRHQHLPMHQHHQLQLQLHEVEQQQRVPLLHQQSQHSLPLHHHNRTSVVTRWKTKPSRHHAVRDTVFFADQPVTGNLGFCGFLLSIFSTVFLLITAPFSLFFCVKIVNEYERAVIFRLGRLIPGGARGPGLFFVNPCIDTYRKVDLRVLTFDVQPQETTLRNVLGTKTLAEMLSDREHISLKIQETLDEATYPWGVKVERVEIKDVRLPYQLQRAMAAEAEATREARAKVIAAEGEELSSKALSQAAELISQSPSAIHLSFLQTLKAISAEKNQTIVVPIPVEIIRWLNRKKNKKQQGKKVNDSGNNEA